MRICCVLCLATLPFVVASALRIRRSHGVNRYVEDLVEHPLLPRAPPTTLSTIVRARRVAQRNSQTRHLFGVEVNGVHKFGAG